MGMAAELRELRPARVFVDAPTQVRHLSADLVDFRRRAQAFLRFLAHDGATVLWVEPRAAGGGVFRFTLRRPG